MVIKRQRQDVRFSKPSLLKKWDGKISDLTLKKDAEKRDGRKLTGLSPYWKLA